MNNDAHGGSRQVAMVGCDEAQAQAWGQRLSLMGCAPVSFDSSDDFLRAVTRGTQGSHFDLLLVVLKDEGAWPVLTSMCKALRLPIFLVANALQRELLAEVLLAAEPEAQGASIDFAVLPVDDFEVELRVREALRRNETLLHPPSVNALFGDYQFIGSRKVVVHKGQDIRLKPRELDGLAGRAQEPGARLLRGEHPPQAVAAQGQRVHAALGVRTGLRASPCAGLADCRHRGRLGISGHVERADLAGGNLPGTGVGACQAWESLPRRRRVVHSSTKYRARERTRSSAASREGCCVSTNTQRCTRPCRSSALPA
jgi:DNA-binding response OmpR family regulator